VCVHVHVICASNDYEKGIATMNNWEHLSGTGATQLEPFSQIV
jgi:hypothetical protein